MLTIKQLSAVKKAATGTPGSSSVERGFDVQIATEPKMAAQTLGDVVSYVSLHLTNHPLIGRLTTCHAKPD
jgi:hypothetical protein